MPVEILPEWSVDDVLVNVRIIFQGGADTSTYAIADALYVLAT